MTRLEAVCRAICAWKGENPDENAVIETVPAFDDACRARGGRDPSRRGPRWQKYEPRARLFLACLDAAATPVGTS